jgi:GNAT superfamily N-acetyltransferase
MGLLACRTDLRGKGLGRLLMGCAVDRCLQARKQGGSIRVDRGFQERSGEDLLRALQVHILHGFTDDTLLVAGLSAGVTAWLRPD